MRSKLTVRSLIIGISLLSLSIVGCTQASNSETRLTESPPVVEGSPSGGGTGGTSSPAATDPNRGPDVVYVPTPMSVVNEMLRVANVQADDIVYDLGSGDGRIVIAAAQQRGARGIGIDIDPQRIQEANANAEKAGVTDRVQFRQQDLFQTDFSNASVVTLYLLPELNLKLKPKLLRELKPGTRIVSHAFDMGDWKPEQILEVDGRTIYYWVVPEDSSAISR